MVQFSTTNYSGSELAGEILVNVLLIGGTADRNITIPISLNSTTTSGQFCRYVILYLKALQMMISVLLLLTLYFSSIPLPLQLEYQ